MGAAAAALGLALATLPGHAAAAPFHGNYLAATESRYSAIVADAKTGMVLYEARPDVQRFPASITKVMTLYLAFDALEHGRLKLGDRVPFSAHAVAQAPSKLGLRAGESISVDEAIQAMTVHSANDAAVALAEKIGGTEARFTAMMTAKAHELGMRNTNFATPNGLPNPHNVSTARDIALMARAVMRDYPQYYHYFGQKELVFDGRQIRNHNHLLTEAPGVDGMKTGYIGAAGFNIVISGVKDGRRLIVVVLGGPSRRARDANAKDLLLTGYEVEAAKAEGRQMDFAENLYETPLGGRAREPAEVGEGDSGSPHAAAHHGRRHHRHRR